MTQIRDATEEIERECVDLRRENEEIRSLLALMGAVPVLPSAVESLVPVHRLQLQQDAQRREPGLPRLDDNTAASTQSETPSVDKMVTLSTDDIMQLPCYKITSSSPGMESSSGQLSLDEEDLAINFILACVERLAFRTA